MTGRERITDQMRYVQSHPFGRPRPPGFATLRNPRETLLAEVDKARKKMSGEVRPGEDGGIDGTIERWGGRVWRTRKDGRGGFGDIGENVVNR